MPDTQTSRDGDSISFRQLKLFESVGRLNSVRRGSEECNLSQPAVTQALTKLEQQLGIILLERRASGSYLTAAGQIMHRRVSRLFRQFEQALVDLGVPGGLENAHVVANRLSRAQARSLIAIIDCGSFALAAEKLGLTQASLQRAARDLESNLRQPIYYRTAAGVMVTPAGIEFGRKIRLALQEIEWGIQEIESARGAGESRIVIGALPFGGSMLLASVLEDFVASHPEVDLRIVNEGASVMMKSLRAGDVDLVLGLVQDTQAADLSNQFLAETPYRIAARRGHPLTRLKHVTLEDLLAFDWVVGAPGSSRRCCFERLFANTAQPRAQISGSAISVVRHLLSGSNRLTLMTSYEIIHEADTLVPLPFDPITPVPVIGVTMRSNWLPTQMHHDFIRLLRERVMTSSVLPFPRRAS
ncbi:LysR family transcriptional regulator [Novosphingobium rosa]|uniref:LysR family transcriptional regulator n=1 Tax=Novosphingobium rosa TaxID=76978 RepID=UPI000835B9D1|nr:LysR family transcriptional regulator [Novosphingobium rosa]